VRLELLSKLKKKSSDLFGKLTLGPPACSRFIGVILEVLVDSELSVFTTTFVTNRIEIVTFGVREIGKNMQRNEGVADCNVLRRLDHISRCLGTWRNST
jgi:hypothetical protein